MLFIDNKYTKLYHQLVRRGQARDVLDGYHEVHHIVPKSLGGSNSATNLVKLTAREHFVCHLLLVKMTEGPSKSKMVYALNFMSNRLGYHKISGRLYDMIKREYAATKAGFQHTDDTKLKMRLTHLANIDKGVYCPGVGMKGKSWEELYGDDGARKRRTETIVKISQALTGRPSTRKGISTNLKGKPATREYKTPWNKGLSVDDPRVAAYGKRGAATRAANGPQEKGDRGKFNSLEVKCPHCGKTGGQAAMHRWHFDNCKHK